MLRPMRAHPAMPLLLLASLALAGCGPACLQSADIQVSILPNADVDRADITRLHLMLRVQNGLARVHDLDLTTPLPAAGTTLLLHPDPPPAPRYDLELIIEALATDGTLLALGTNSGTFVDNGCNLLPVHLATLGSLDMAPPDLTQPIVPGADLSTTAPPDLAGCVGGLPDEDADGRANFCDLCPADADAPPVDSDGDGLPDACDPDPATPGNRALYFDPFDVNSGHWSGSSPVASSYRTLDPGMPGVTVASNTVDALPLDVRAQAMILPRSYYATAGPIDAGLFVGTNADPSAPGSQGVHCRLDAQQNQLEIVVVKNGTEMGVAQQMPLAIMGAVYRLRLTERGGAWTCEAAPRAMNPVVTVTATLTVTAPLYMALRSASMEARFNSVVAETALP
jgi:hypothetical protein